MNNHSTPYICSPEGEISTEGAVAQSVEQRTENPCVAGSIPAHTTKTSTAMLGFFVILMFNEQKDIYIVYSSFYFVLHNSKCKLLGSSKT